MDKKGMELSINFIVMLILAIVVFGFGLYFAQRVFTEANVLKANLAESTQNQIIALLNRGDQVAVPVTSVDVNAGQPAVFGIGILNTLASQAFTISVQCTVAIDRNSNPITLAQGGGCDNTIKISDNGLTTVTIAAKKQDVIPIAIQIPSSKKKGTYGFTITVKDSSGKTYGDIKQIYVNTN